MPLIYPERRAAFKQESEEPERFHVEMLRIDGRVRESRAAPRTR
jgi:hypothetical protein